MLPYTAKIIQSNLPDFRGKAHLYELSEPVEFDYDFETDTNKQETNYVIVSATTVLYSGPETYIFPASKEGNILSWQELSGSFRGALDHAQALQNAGYQVI